MKPHPIFEHARPSRRWTGQLLDLGALLRKDPPDEAWNWRVLPHGAVIGMRRRPIEGHRRHELRIARNELPKDEKLDRFERECGIFLRHLGCAGWYRTKLGMEKAPPVIYAEYVELVGREVRPGWARCDRCNIEVPAEHLYATERCQQCAIRAGQEATQTRTP